LDFHSLIPFLKYLISLLIVVTGCHSSQDCNESIDLSGMWNFQLES
jgi:hypothetical protein